MEEGVFHPGCATSQAAVYRARATHCQTSVSARAEAESSELVAAILPYCLLDLAGRAAVQHEGEESGRGRVTVFPEETHR